MWNHTYNNSLLPARVRFYGSGWAGASAATIPSLFLGPKYDRRLLVFMVLGRGDGGGARTFTSLTVGGIPAIKVAEVPSNAQPQACFILPNTGLTFADVIPTASGTVSNNDIMVSVFNVLDYRWVQPIDSNSQTGTDTAGLAAVKTLPDGVLLTGISINSLTDQTYTSVFGHIPDTNSTLTTPGAGLTSRMVRGRQTKTGLRNLRETWQWTTSVVYSILAVSWR